MFVLGQAGSAASARSDLICRALPLRGLFVIERGAPERQQAALPAPVAQRRVVAHNHRAALRPAERDHPSPVPVWRGTRPSQAANGPRRQKLPVAPRSAPRSWREDRGPRSQAGPGPAAHLGALRDLRTSTNPSIAWRFQAPTWFGLRGDLLKRPLAPKRLQRHLRLQLSPKTCVACCSSAFLRQAVEYTLARTFGANLLI